jgi:hypothetical protein
VDRTDLRIGEELLGEFARTQIEAARRDPRLGRERGAMVADFWDAMEEAERVRMLGVLGLHELADAEERERARLGMPPGTKPAADALPALQAAWERAELANSEIANGHPHLNAQALLSMNSALDALIEEFVPAVRAMRVRFFAEQAINRAKDLEPEAAEQVSAEMEAAVLEAAEELLGERLPELEKMRGSGTNRYEPRLAQEGLAAPSDRPIPDDLDQALTELGALRDVLVHRAGRVDAKAVRQAPTLRYREGELVRITGAEYRTYSAAVRCYGAEVAYRPIRQWPDTSDAEHGPNLSGWRGYYRINA